MFVNAMAYSELVLPSLRSSLASSALLKFNVYSDGTRTVLPDVHSEVSTEY